ncbi:D-arabinono-1,4-lactone oxidase [Ideonella sp.]|uniref:D-arabinono-1,4-lactone oxidase n=1 Tax=Ideonella sp. TaxID=1929293 RepID=UPI0035B3156C
MSRRALLRGIGAAGVAAALRPVSAWAAGPAASGAPSAAPKPAWHNWSGLQSCQPAAWAVPATEDETLALLRNAAAPLRSVGAGHSFTQLVPTEGTLLSMDRLAGLRAHDAAAGTATLGAGTRLAAASRALDAVGLAFLNLPDIDVQTLAGALATATHGTGAKLPALHAEAQQLTLLTPRGERIVCSRTQRPEVFAAAQVSLGALGVLSEVTLRVRPRHVLHRRVWLMPTEELLQAVPTLAATHHQFECYLLPHTGYGAAITHDEVNEAPRTRPPAPDEDVLRDLKRLRDWFGRWPALRRWVAQKAIDPTMTEEATDWSWKLLSTQRPTRFNESECHVPREQGVACLREVLATLEKRDDVFFPIEFRFIAADDAWLSPFHGRDSCSIAVHAAHDEPWDYLVKDIGAVYRRHAGRPHWGKLHDRTAAELRALYPRWNDFQQVRRELDPTGRMLNPYLRRLFGET